MLEESQSFLSPTLEISVESHKSLRGVAPHEFPISGLFNAILLTGLLETDGEVVELGSNKAA